MKVNRREWALGLSTLAVGLYAVLGVYGRSWWIGAWTESRREADHARDSIARSRNMVAERERWEGEMNELQSLMPVFPHDKRMDVHWLGEMERKAMTHQLKIIRHEVGAEQREGPVYEMPVYCRRWEGTLDALVHFLFDLQSEGAMLDVRYLHIKPKDKDIHDGRFDLFCAYRREESASGGQETVKR